MGALYGWSKGVHIRYNRFGLLAVSAALAIYAYQIHGKQGPASYIKSKNNVEVRRWPAMPVGMETAAHTARAREVLQESNGRSELNTERWNKKPIPKRMTAFGTVGNGIGYDGGYTGLDVMFAPEYPAFAVMPFVEAQGIFIFENNWAANLGVGGRSLSDKIPAIVGFNAFYSFREGDHGSYHQLGIGAELIGKRWELNANGYIPLGNTKHVRKCVYDDYIGDYKAVRKKKESSLFGANAALSILAVQTGDFMLYATGGPYFLTGKSGHPQVWGGQIAIQPQFGDYFALSFIVSSDNFYGTLYQGGFVLSLPLYQFTKLKKPRLVTNRQIYQPVKRMLPIIPLEEQCCWKSNF